MTEARTNGVPSEGSAIRLSATMAEDYKFRPKSAPWNSCGRTLGEEHLTASTGSDGELTTTKDGYLDLLEIQVRVFDFREVRGANRFWVVVRRQGESFRSDGLGTLHSGWIMQ